MILTPPLESGLGPIFRDLGIMMAEGRLNLGCGGNCRAHLEMLRKQILGALALWMCPECLGESEHNTDNDTDPKNANLGAVNLLLYPRQLLVFHIYL